MNSSGDIRDDSRVGEVGGFSEMREEKGGKGERERKMKREVGRKREEKMEDE